MHHLAHNLSLMCRESHRHLVADVGPGKMPRNGGTYTGNGWDGGYSDGVNNASTDVDFAGTAVAWDRRTARSYHLANLIADRKLPGGGYGLRVIEVEIDCYLATANTLQLFAALTASYNTPDQGSLATSTWSDWSSATFTGNTDRPADTLPSGRQTVRLWLITKTPAGASWAQWKARDSATVAAAASMVYEGHLWVGWRSSNSDNAIISINAWEVPDPWNPPLSLTAGRGYVWGTRMDWNPASVGVDGNEYVTSLMDSFSVGGGAGPAVYVELNRSGFGGTFCGQFRKTDSSYGNCVFSGPTTNKATIYAVIVPKNSPSGGYVPVAEYVDSLTPPMYPPARGFGIRSQGTEYGFWADDPTTGFVGSTLTAGKAYIVTGVMSTTTVYWYVNGVLDSSVARPAAGSRSYYGAIVGFHSDAITDAPSSVGDFDLHEFITYLHDHSVEERAFVLEYLNRRYGVF